MSYRVKIENFDGPFELLLSLVSKDKVDIGSISITEIADQYLAEIQRLKALDLNVASDFLLVAATLLEIKAQSLLPKPQIELDEDVAELSPNEARDILVERLMNYKKYKNAAGALYERFEAEGRMHSRPFGPDAVFLQVMPDFLKGVTTDALGLMAAGSYARREVFLLESEHIAAKPLPVEVHVRAIHQRIRNKKHLKFSELVTEDTPTEVLVVTFLALLELFKRAMVHLNQPNPFGDIMVDYIEGSGELVLDEQHGLTSIEE
ncbi:segregation and condensation protein A [Parvibacter caecicola]|uniref:Segregation and condensation protein A n=1 Tax=Parvibacter caecicola TaxID=747645 RepID=A0A7W5D0J0_9ACTN|nr:segregation/condensation protein A [Parvibacter caecicola]MBB3170587.1 segregation and condensation protein A [Parvibacter caecicola]MCR2041452.1 segregation/condensation protein A [Parvibacter caecicola]RNL12034.1 segregation/condensation protein A [Parvibacter caecicola]